MFEIVSQKIIRKNNEINRTKSDLLDFTINLIGLLFVYSKMRRSLLSHKLYHKCIYSAYYFILHVSYELIKR